jgi:hypothetical protein
VRAEGVTFILLSCLCIGGPAHAGMDAAHIWTFDEGQGSQALDSEGGRSGTVWGARWVPGRIGTALQFDGSDDYVALPNNEPVWLPVNNFSVCFWVYFERDAAYSTYYDNEVLVDLNHGSSSNSSNELGYVIMRRGDTGELGFQMTTMTDPDDDLYARTIPVKGRWYHVAAVRRGTTQEIYIDGELDASRVCTSTPITFVGGYDDDLVNVGRYTNTADWPRYYFKGMMDELVLFDRALTSAEVRQLYRDGTPCNWHVDTVHGSDRNDGLSSGQPFATIQKAIQEARDGDTINVYPGVYRESIRFLGKAITVQSAADAVILEAPGRTAVSFDMGEGPDSVLRNVIIRDSSLGIDCIHSGPTVVNVTVAGNRYAARATAAFVSRDPRPSIGNSILWDNVENAASGFDMKYCCVQIPRRDGIMPSGIGNFSEDPLFVDPANGDYHVRSEHGRYWAEHGVWVVDDVTSPCVDAGDPAADASAERKPNGGRLNIGAHGGTACAEMSDMPFSGDVNGDGVFDNHDYEAFMILWEQRRQSEPPTVPKRR